MATGGFIGIAPGSLTTGDAGAGSIFLSPVTAQQNGTAVAFLINTPSATASTTFKAVVYDGSHSALLASSATVTSLVSGYNRIALTSPLTLVAGSTYYIGYVCSTSCPVTIWSNGDGVRNSWFASGGQSVTSPANPLVIGAGNGNLLMIALELDGTGLTQTGFGPDQAIGVTLTSTNTVATFPLAPSNRHGARSIVTHTPGSGKWYAEVLVGGVIENTVGVGLASANWGINQGPGILYYDWVLVPFGDIAAGGLGQVHVSLPYVTGDVIGIAYDAVSNFIWFNKNNGSWFGASSSPGNPSSGTGGLSMAATQWPLSVIVGNGFNATAAIFTLRDIIDSQQFAAPAGFFPWTPPPLSQGFGVALGVSRSDVASAGAATALGRGTGFSQTGLIARDVVREAVGSGTAQVIARDIVREAVGATTGELRVRDLVRETIGRGTASLRVRDLVRETVIAPTRAINVNHTIPAFTQTFTFLKERALVFDQTIPAFPQTLTLTVPNRITVDQLISDFAQTFTLAGPGLVFNQTIPDFAQEFTLRHALRSIQVFIVAG
jgi:hypothetical protein